MSACRAAFALLLSVALPACGNHVDFDGSVAHPAYAKGAGPVVLFDQGHHNHHDLSGTYAPAATVLANDGFQLRTLRSQYTADSLSGASILLIVTAASPEDPNDAPAFTPEEVRTVTEWVKAGHSLLLVTDHYPFPNAVSGLASALGLQTSNGMTFDKKHFREGTDDDSRLIFSHSNGLLADHAITRGRNPSERVSTVETFTGDAFRSVQPAGDLLKLSASSQLHTGVPHIARKGGDSSVTVEFVDPRPGAGWSQGTAFDFGRGRVVAFADAAMLTAAEDGGRKLGFNAPGNENRQLLLNSMHWLARII